MPEAGAASAFSSRDGELWCADVPISELVARYGTPLYVYSAVEMRARVRRLRRAFGERSLICFAVKANPNLHVLSMLHGEGCGFDLVSGGELERLRLAGLPASGSVFAGVAKQPWEIAAAVAAGVKFINVESPHELALLSEAGEAAGAPVRVALRINPDVDAGTHPYISTGTQENKFGVALSVAGGVVDMIGADPWLNLVGYHVHLGSQLLSVAPYRAALDRMLEFVDGDARRRDGVRYYDLGGGFGISFGEAEPLDVGEIAQALVPDLDRVGWTPVVEPGRFITGEAGALITSVVGEKKQGGANFVLVDAAMNDFIRPALYGAEHPIVPVAASAGEPERVVDVVGPVCETGDFLGRARSLPRLARGDLLAVLAAGAYGASMSSNYNSRLRPAEVLVDGQSFRLVRRRETLQSLCEDELEC